MATVSGYIRPLFVLLLWTAVFHGILADISGLDPAVGTCICLDTDGVNVRDYACGTVIGSSNTGQCFNYRGQKVGCSLSGTIYQYFELDYGGSSGWIAGDFMVLGSDIQCGIVSEPASEFRALFVATAWNVDWPSSSFDSVLVQQQELHDYLEMMETSHMNAVVFQVRPVGDAMYDSAIEPWSRFLTGTQGQAPVPHWDPLQYLVAEAHSRGIEVHAWLNPYRANLSPDWSGLAPNHMANVYSQYAYPYSNYLWMDPGASVVVDHLVSVIQDIIARYNVDGIHFDDYFYPYPDGNDFPDSSTYNDYVSGGGSLSRDDWRRDNVNQMIQRVQGVVHSARPDCKFSVSPFGIYRPGAPSGMPSPPIVGLDPFTSLYADSKLWFQSGWVDFLAPQLYWAIDPPAQSYPTLLDWWLNENTANVHVYAANGVYKISDNDWPVSEIENQISMSRDSIRRSQLSLGNVMYSAKYFRDNTKGITTAFQTRVYTHAAAVPPIAALNLPDPDPPVNLRLSKQGLLSWAAAASETGHSDVIGVRWWLVMRRGGTDDDWSLYKVLPVGVRSLPVDVASGAAAFAVRAANGAWQHSAPTVIHSL